MAFRVKRRNLTQFVTSNLFSSIYIKQLMFIFVLQLMRLSQNEWNEFRTSFFLTFFPFSSQKIIFIFQLHFMR